jgi:multiple sugar transport system permease protein
MIIVIPLYLQFVKLGMLNEYLGVIIIYAGLRLAFSVFLLTTFFKGIPIEVMEAADMDGCTKLGVLRYVILPLSVPAVLSLTLINFNACWNDLLIGILFLQKPEMQTIMVATAQFKGKIDSSPTSILAASLIATVVVMIIYGFTQRYFVKGLTLGSIK